MSDLRDTVDNEEYTRLDILSKDRTSLAFNHSHSNIYPATASHTENHMPIFMAHST